MVRNGFNNLMAQQALFSIDVIEVMWSFHDNELSMIKHKNFVPLILEFIELGTSI